MDDALAHWLALRESADAAARSEPLVAALVEALPSGRPVAALDLATGTGANIRYLAPRLPSPQRWLAVDRSSHLLAVLPQTMGQWVASRGGHIQKDGSAMVIECGDLECRVETACIDLGELDQSEGIGSMFQGRDLATASALLDLVSEEWIRRLAGYSRAVGAAVLFALTYDGRSSCSPPDRLDDVVLSLLNRHQQSDKGLGGVAAGPGAASLAPQCLAGAGYHTRSASSDWNLHMAEAALQQQLIDGWLDAACELEPEAAGPLRAWRDRRRRYVETGKSCVTVGHVDVAAWLPCRTSHAE